MIRTSGIQPRTSRGHAPRLLARWSFRVPAETWPRLVRESSFVATFAVLYEEISEHTVQAGATAASHALGIVSAEQALGLFRERAVQAWFIGSDTVTDAFNAYYGGTHFLIPLLVLGWLLFRHPAHYARARTVLAAVTAVAFVVFWLYPVAPPRLLPAQFGIVDMLTNPDGSGHFETSLINAAGDQYASMPSLHVAWAVWCALAVYPVARHWLLRALAVGYPLLTTLVVIATGNHFFLDAIAGALLACATWVTVTRIRERLTVQAATRHLRTAGHSPGYPERERGTTPGPRYPHSVVSPARLRLTARPAELRLAARTFEQHRRREHAPAPLGQRRPAALRLRPARSH